MSRHLVKSLATFAVLIAAASCASTSEQREKQEPPLGMSVPEQTWEPWPPPDAARTSRPPSRASTQTVTLEPKAGGWRIDEIFEMVSRTTGVSLLYDNANATFKQAKVEFVGTHVIPQSELFPWLQSVLSYRKLVLVPVGPKATDGKQQWMVMDQADPNLKSKPVFLEESEILDYADRDGLYVVTTLRVRDTVDTNRARNALSPLSTQTAGIGRIQDIPGARALIVGDFAPVVAAMKQLLDRINAAATPSASWQPAAPPAPAPAPRSEK